jgi:hypothetical protein
MLAGDVAHAPIPFSIFLLLMASYALHHQTCGEQALVDDGARTRDLCRDT